jgi:hypothetical protein
VSKVDVSMNGIELQDREFFAAIREGREPNVGRARLSLDEPLTLQNGDHLVSGLCGHE